MHWSLERRGEERTVPRVLFGKRTVLCSDAIYLEQLYRD